MKTPFYTYILAPAVLAQGLRQATGGDEPTSIVQQYPTPTPEVSTCTASLLTTLCDYKPPGSAFAIASSGKAYCWEYCNAHQPCNFVIFAAGNPYTGTGTCWLYPGESFDAALGTSGCDHLSVFDKPVCAAAPTPTASGCAATASPSAVAEVCGYPTPDDDCWASCAASSGAGDCLAQCAAADACAYVVFNPHNEDNSPYSSGTCWMYANGTYEAGRAGSCSGVSEQYVYENQCPKAVASTSGSASQSLATSGSALVTGAAASATGAAGDVEAEGASGTAAKPTANAVPVGFGVSGLLVAGVVAVMWQGVR